MWLNRTPILEGKHLQYNYGMITVVGAYMEVEMLFGSPQSKRELKKLNY